jgi:hypothetical protein
MIAPSARRTGVLAAAIITGAAASAFGQQVANLDEQQRLKAHLKIECPQGGDACEIPAAKRFYDALTVERRQEEAAALKGEATALKGEATALKGEATALKGEATALKGAAEHRAAREAAEKNIAEHQKAAEAANEIVREARCADDLKAGVDRGILSRARGRELLNGKLPSQYGNCLLLNQLRAFAGLSKS